MNETDSSKSDSENSEALSSPSKVSGSASSSYTEGIVADEPDFGDSLASR
jgi:hypothetical protein